MKETTPSAMPPCFDRWCRRFDDLFNHPAQKKGFRHYLGGLLGESERKNLSQIAADAVGVTYHRLHHFLTESVWSGEAINERRLEVMNKCSQTRISFGFSLIVDDSGHRKSGNFTGGVGRQYISEIGKTDNGIVVVTTHLYDGTKSLPLDIELYQHGTSLPEGKKDPAFQKKPDIALSLIERSLKRGYRPGIVLLDAGYGNNTSFLIELEKKNLKYIGGLAKNRKVSLDSSEFLAEEIRLDKLCESLSANDFSMIKLLGEKPRTLWVTIQKVKLSQLEGFRTIAIVMNAPSFNEATELDYLLTNFDPSMVTPQWIITTYTQRNWIEVFYREAKGWLGLKEYRLYKPSYAKLVTETPVK